MDRLTDYRRKRDRTRTSEPMPRRSRSGPARSAGGNSFVVQEHHASSLHWDFRLERDGVLVSWAVPKGLPPDPKVNVLAVHVEDHPLEYADFEGTIADGEYGAGEVSIWDRGRYDTEKWSDREVKVVLHGERVQGRFVLFRTRGKNWMMHRMDAPARPDWQPLPTGLQPMLATAGALPRRRAGWAFEMQWDGLRVLVRVEGGRLAITAGDQHDVTGTYPELRELGEQLGSTQVLLDGKIVSFDADGRPDPERLRRRVQSRSPAVARRLASTDPVALIIFDLLHLDGRSLLELPYAHRRELLLQLELAGPAWQVPPAFEGTGAAAVRASREHGLAGVVAKRLSSPYTPGRRSPDWRQIAHERG